MKHSTRLLGLLPSALLALAALSSCSDALSEMGLPFQSEPDGRWGLIGVDGEVMYSEEFKPDQQPTAAIGNRFFVRGADGNWVMYATGESAPQAVGKQHYAGVSYFYNDVAILTPLGEQVQIIDKDGKCIKKLGQIASRDLSRVTGFDEKGFAIFAVGEDDETVYGLINRKGEVVIEPRYCVLNGRGNYYHAIDAAQRKDYAEGHADKVVVSILNASGKELFNFKLSKYDDYRLFEAGYMAFHQEERGYGLLDMSGQEVMTPDNDVTRIDDIRKGAVIYADEEGNYGVMDLQGHVVIRPKYSSLSFAADHLLWAGIKREGKEVFQLVDLTGQKVGSEAYRDVLPFYDGDMAFVKFTSKDYGLIDKNGREFTTMVDVCNIERFGGYRTNWLEPDIIDVDALFKHIDMSEKGLGVFHLDMSTSEVVTAYRKKDTEAPVSLPQNYLYTSRLDYTDSFKGGKFDVLITTDGYLSDSSWEFGGETSYFWMPSKVSTIALTLRGDKVVGRTRRIYDALVEHISQWGKVRKTGRRGACIALAADRGYVVTYDDATVSITLYNNNGFIGARLDGEPSDELINEVLPDSVAGETLIW